MVKPGEKEENELKSAPRDEENDSPDNTCEQSCKSKDDNKNINGESEGNVPVENSCEGEDLKARVESLEKTLEEKQREIDEYKNRWYRAQADFDNYRKRMQKEIQDIHLYAGEQLIKDILPVVDNFERALNSVDDKESPVYKGIQLIYQQLKKVLEKYDVKEIDAQGKVFDPRFHEAVMQVESQDYENDTVVEVLQKGYLFHSKVIRPSMVKVAKK